MKSDSEREITRLERKIELIRKKDFIPVELLDLVEKVARLTAEEKARVELPALSRGELAEEEQNLKGAPLRPRSDFSYDKASVDRMYERLIDLCKTATGPVSEAAAIIEKAGKAGEFDIHEACKAFISEDEKYFAAWAEKTPGAPLSVHFLAQTALTPSLEAFAAQTAEFVPAKRAWQHGHCPVCGSPPLISRLLEKEGYRHMTCSFCHAEYRTPRIMCPFCGEKAQEEIQYFHVKEEPGYMVHVCKKCKAYIKTADFRELDRTSMPLLDDLESIALDVLAQEKGYARMTLSAWGF